MNEIFYNFADTNTRHADFNIPIPCYQIHVIWGTIYHGRLLWFSSVSLGIWWDTTLRQVNPFAGSSFIIILTVWYYVTYPVFKLHIFSRFSNINKVKHTWPIVIWILQYICDIMREIIFITHKFALREYAIALYEITWYVSFYWCHTQDISKEEGPVSKWYILFVMENDISCL